MSDTWRFVFTIALVLILCTLLPFVIDTNAAGLQMAAINIAPGQRE